MRSRRGDAKRRPRVCRPPHESPLPLVLSNRLFASADRDGLADPWLSPLHGGFGNLSSRGLEAPQSVSVSDERRILRGTCRAFAVSKSDGCFCEGSAFTASVGNAVVAGGLDLLAFGRNPSACVCVVPNS